MRKILIFALCLLVCLPLSGCGADSYKALLSIESGTKTSWSQSHHLLDGTKSHVFNFGKEQQEMLVEVVTEKGTVDITATDKNGETVFFIEGAETGIYEFEASGKIKFRINAEEHRGSVSVKKADS